MILSILIHYILRVFFKLEEFEQPDDAFAFMDKKEAFILMGCLKIDKLDTNYFKQMFIEKGLKKFWKLRSIKLYICGFLSGKNNQSKKL